MRFLRFWVFFPHKWLDRFFLRSIRANNSSFELVLPMGFLFCCCNHRLWRCGRACVFLALRLLLLHDDGGSWGGGHGPHVLGVLGKEWVMRSSTHGWKDFWSITSIMSLVYNHNFLVDFWGLVRWLVGWSIFNAFFAKRERLFGQKKTDSWGWR